MKPVTISLTFSRDKLETLYFKDNNGSWFFNQFSGLYFKVLLIVIAISCPIFIPIIPLDRGPVTITLTSVVVVITALIWLKSLLTYSKWRKQVDDYMEEALKSPEQNLILKPESITLKQKDTEIIEKWKNIRKVEILDDHLVLYSEHNFVLPKSTMSENDYSVLGEFVREKMG